jgi:hypothetical protein
MAKQKGLITLTGTLGGINFFVSRNKGLARRAGGGFTSKAIKTKPSMQRVRENASEFGHCSKVKKHYLRAFLPFFTNYKDSTLHSRMMTLFTTLKDLDGTSVRGERRVVNGLETVKGQRLLRQFEFTPKHPFISYLHGRSQYDAATQTITVNDFLASHKDAPKTATHMGVMMGVLDFDFTTLKSDLRLSSTHYIPLNTSAYFSLQPDVVLPIEHYGVVILGARYYEIFERPDGADEIYPMGGVGVSCDF